MTTVKLNKDQLLLIYVALEEKAEDMAASGEDINERYPEYEVTYAKVKRAIRRCVTKRAESDK